MQGSWHGLLPKAYRSGSCLLCVFQQHWPSLCSTNVLRLLCLLFLLPETLFSIDFFWLPPVFRSQLICHLKEAFSKHPILSSMACTSTLRHYYIIGYSLYHLSLSEIIFFIYLFTCFFQSPWLKYKFLENRNILVLAIVSLSLVCGSYLINIC